LRGIHVKAYWTDHQISTVPRRRSRRGPTRRSTVRAPHSESCERRSPARGRRH